MDNKTKPLFEGDDYVDITEDVTCYEHGKTFECDCGQGFGVKFDLVTVNCPTCHKICYDVRASERGPPEKPSGQTGLGDFV